jgi:exosortase/archaeosortase family protein
VAEIGLFMFITVVFHNLWWAFATEIKSLEFIGRSADLLANEVYRGSYWVNARIFHMEIIEENHNVMRFANQKALQVAESCSGLKQFFQIAILFLLYPGPWKHKIWFIPLGFVAIHLTNILRVAGLSVWMANDIPFWEFGHNWVMRPIYYIVIFTLWYIWNQFIFKKTLV